MYRELTTKEIDALLEQEIFGNLGCCQKTKPFIFPMAYLYHDNVIYGQTITGHKTRIIRENPSVCFQVHQVQEKGWASAMCWGTFQELDFSELKESDDQAIVTLLIDKLASVQHSIGIDVEFMKGSEIKPMRVNDQTSTLFRILVEEKTGKYHGEYKK